MAAFRRDPGRFQPGRSAAHHQNAARRIGPREPVPAPFELTARGRIDEAAYPVVAGWPSSGLSPRRRGNHPRGHRPHRDRGPIPAQAGEPSPFHTLHSFMGAYPRAGGGTFFASDRSRCTWGLSPRRRGNRHEALHVLRLQGPIPAQAGEPAIRRKKTLDIQAYPRAGGGTAVERADGTRVWGLSPRRRGNHPRRQRGLARRGPIPAQAGEPLGTKSLN